MSSNSARGFTIIEVVLFLAITGALFAALMIGVGTGLTQQRYLGTVRSYKALIQDQYTAVLNPANEPNGHWGCDASSGTVTQTAVSSPGASDCIILGRAIQISDDGQKVTTSSVIGYQTATSLTKETSDLTAIRDAKPTISSFDEQDSQLDGGVTLYDRDDSYNGSDTSRMVILILRSPVSGTIRVFVWRPASTPISSNADVQAAIDNSPTKMKDCIDGDSGALPKEIITIDTTIASIDGVSTADAGSGGCSA